MSREEEQGLFAMTAAEAETMLEWGRRVDIAGKWRDEDQPLWDRLFVWAVRHAEGRVSLHGD